MVTTSQRPQLEKAKQVLRYRRFIKVKHFCKLMDGMIWQQACKLLNELGWYKYNGYQWAHPSTKKTL